MIELCDRETRFQPYERLLVPGWILLIFVSTLLCGCEGQRTSGSSASAPPSSVQIPNAGRSNAEESGDPRSALQIIGKEVAAAVLAKDIGKLLVHGNSQADDEASLKSAKGNPYCYVFDSSCISDTKARSVYEILSTAQELEIRASVTRSSANSQLFGLLIFYDRSLVSDKQLKSREYLCSDKARRQVVSWHFVLSNGKWNTKTFFDYETEGLC